MVAKIWWIDVTLVDGDGTFHERVLYEVKSINGLKFNGAPISNITNEEIARHILYETGYRPDFYRDGNSTMVKPFKVEIMK